MGPTIKTVEITDVKYVHDTIPAELYTYETPPPVMDQQEYLSLSMPKREEYLSRYIGTLLTYIGFYTVKFDPIKELEQKKTQEPQK